MSIRIGGVPYGVGAPLLGGMEDDADVTLVKAPPTELIRQLRDGYLDAALVSSIEAISAPGYRVVPHLGIACKHEIRSVRAFRRPGPIRSIGLDRSSATSAALLRVLLARVHHAEVAAEATWTAIAPTREPAATPYDLVLMIGDHGLGADAGRREVWDLGQQWRAYTGLPFVFALWLLRPGADATKVLPVLQRGRARGRLRKDVDGTFGAAHYELDAEDRLGLQRFWSEARALGLAHGADPAFTSHMSERTDTEGFGR